MTTKRREKASRKEESRITTAEPDLYRDPRWYKDAVIYEVHVRAFKDGNADGIGDFTGLTEKLDYLRELGITVVWLLPFFPSPLRDDGYDIADYYRIHPDYGTMATFKRFLREAHKRGIRVIGELVINHTSTEHAWFRSARKAKAGTPERDLYVWSDTPTKYADARIIFKDFEVSNWTYDPVAGSYYWHRFYAHQPDLNFDNPEVQRRVIEILDYWFKIGIDGLRLDAIPYLYERDGTMCENLPETHDFLKKLRKYTDEHFPGRVLLAEANQWPEDAVAYFGYGTECHMAFHFPLMPRLFMSVWMEDSFPVIDILKSTPMIPENCQWAMFLRNHDELTLEMVTDEERDYMYRAYARDPRMKINLGIRKRLAPLLGNNRRKIEMMNILLFSFPGTPVLYYGDEIGMGDNHFLGDRNGVRTPMQWNAGKNAGFSNANPQMLYLPVIIDPHYHYEMVNVENQQENPSSQLCWMKRVIAMRNRYKVFGRGDIRFVTADNPKVIAFMRTWRSEQLLVIVNLSRFMQVATLDLSSFEGLVPEELFSRNHLPVIDKKPYVLTLGPYDHFWLMLQKQQDGELHTEGVPQVIDTGSVHWSGFLTTEACEVFQQQVLPYYLMKRNWTGTGRTITSVAIIDEIAIDNNHDTMLLLLSVRYKDGSFERYLLPLAFEPLVTGHEAGPATKNVLCVLQTRSGRGYLCDGGDFTVFQSAMLALIIDNRSIRGVRGTLKGVAGRRLKAIIDRTPEQLNPRPVVPEQRNILSAFGDKLFLKCYRKLEDGMHPEIEMLRFLSSESSFTHSPRFTGMIEYRGNGSQPLTIGLLESFATSVDTCWNYFLQTALHFCEQLLARKDRLSTVVAERSEFDSGQIGKKIPALFIELSGTLFYDMVALLGHRTAEMHRALADAHDNERFMPEPFSPLYQRSLFQSLHSKVVHTMQRLRTRLSTLNERCRTEALAIVDAEYDLLSYARSILRTPFDSKKIRIHGDYHLGQVLFTGKDFIIIDFEGQVTRSYSERSLKYSCFRDLAAMVRSLHYAAYSAMLLYRNFSSDQTRILEPWIERWYVTVAETFLAGYADAVGDAPFVPQSYDNRVKMLYVYLLDKTIQEISNELDHRLDWIDIPLKGLFRLLHLLKNDAN